MLPQLGTLHLTLRVYLRLANRPSAQFANSSNQEQPSSFKNYPQALGAGTAQVSIVAYLEQEMPLFFSYNLLNARNRKIPTNKLLTRTKVQCFLNQAPRSFFKKLVISMPLLLQGLHKMSLAKSVPDGLSPQEFERTKLREPPPVPYVPTKDEVQEEVAKLRNLEIKTTIEKDTTLNFPVWHEKNGTQEAFLMQVMAVLDAIKKRGTLRTTRRQNRLMWKPRRQLSQQRLV